MNDMSDATEKSHASRAGSGKPSRPPHAGFADKRPQRPFRAEKTESFRRKPENSARHDANSDAARLRRDGDTPPKNSRREAALGPLRDVDEDILRLIARRSRLLAKMPDSGKAARERDLRTHWEEEASRLSRDPKLIRQMFALLQEIQIADEDLGGNAFNLAPAAQPVDIKLTLPAACRQIRILSTLAAASGQPINLQGVTLNAPLLECIKALNQAGASLRWEEFPTPCVSASAGEGISGTSRPVLDKVIHAGDNPFTLYLLLFQLITRQTRVKLIGESSLRFLNLSAVRHFMPSLGCRLSAMVPGQDGLPVRLESSALLPEYVKVPAQLPADAVTALLLAAPFWDKPVRFDLEAHANSRAILDEIEVYFKACGCTFKRERAHIAVTPGSILPAASTLEMTPPLVYALLAMPALTGGRTCLQGKWPVTFPASNAARELLSKVVELSISDNTCESAPLASPCDAWDFSRLPDVLLGTGLVLFIHAVVHGRCKPELPALPKDTDMDIVDDFLLHLGFCRKGQLLAETPEIHSAWAAPDAWWGIAYALGSFIRRNIRLSNPAVVSALAPHFWNIFNSLPTPALSRPSAEQEKPAPVSSPARRRIRSSSFLTAEKLPPALDLTDEY